MRPPVSVSIAALLLAACGGEKTTEPGTTAPPPEPTSITLSGTALSFDTLGATKQVTATVLDQNNRPIPGSTVTWSSSNAAVATVSTTGLVTAAGNGTAEITASLGSLSAAATVTVALVAATVGPEGGMFEFASGVILDIPPGAVREVTTITVKELPPGLDSLLNARDYASHEKHVLGGFIGEPDGLVFDLPIKVIIPTSPRISPGGLGIPIQAEVDLDAQEYWIAPTDLTYDPDENRVEVVIEHFSASMIVELLSALERLCRAGSYSVKSGAIDFQGGTGCQIITDFFTITFFDCPGGPFTEQSTVSETTPECGPLCLSVEVTPADVVVAAGKTKSFQATVRDTASGKIFNMPVFWRSDAPTVASFASLIEGMLTANDLGTARVRACTPDPDICGEANVEVVLNIEGVWNYTETLDIVLFGPPLPPGTEQEGICDIAGTATITQTGRTFTGQFQEVGTCTYFVGPDEPPLVENDSGTGTFQGTFSGASFTIISSFDNKAERCRQIWTFSGGSPFPSQASGTVECSDAQSDSFGTLQAFR